MNYIVESQACPRRLDEIGKIEEQLVCNSFTKTDCMQQADLILYYSCGVTQTAVDRAMSKIAEIMENHPDKKLIVCGCLPAMELEKLRKIFTGPICTPTDFSGINEIIKGSIRREDVKSVEGTYNEKTRRMDIIVVKGCMRRCAFCAIYQSVGPLMSKPVGDIVQFVRECVQKGITAFNFQGDSVGDYGLDQGTNIDELLTAVDAVEGAFTIAVEDLHPGVFLKHFDRFEALVRNKRCEELMIPIQSGSERVLKAMNRSLDMALFRERLLQVKTLGARLVTDIIVGFPGETDDEFDETIALLKDIRFDEVSINLYSDRPNTEASAMEDKLSPRAIMRRCMRLSGAGIVEFDHELLEYQLGHEFKLRKELLAYQEL